MLQEQESDVAAVVVTYNRAELLLDCLAAILAQTRAPKRIFLIDNASTDGTRATLAARGFLSHPIIEYVELASNTGGAGGFAEGMRRAADAGHQWLWLMDDDVEPLPHALEHALSLTHLGNCVQASRQYLDGTSVSWNFIFCPTSLSLTQIISAVDQRDRPFYFANTACFEGMLVSSSIVDKIGLPLTDFFLGYDDTLFGFATSQHTNIVVSTENTFIKKIRPSPSTHADRHYYNLRNLFLLRRRLQLMGYSRSALSTVWFTATLFQRLVAAVSSRGISGFMASARAIHHGLSGRFGKLQ